METSIPNVFLSALMASFVPFQNFSIEGPSQPVVAEPLPTVQEIQPLAIQTLDPKDAYIWVVKPGETLKSIAKEYYGSESFWTTLWNDNLTISDPNSLVENSILYVRKDLPSTPEELRSEVSAHMKNPRELDEGARYVYLMTHPIQYNGLTFSMPLLSYKYVSNPYKLGHPGIDLSTYHNTPIYASADGTVVEAGWSSIGYGNTVLIAHQNGMVTRYAHLSSIKVRKGQYLTRGAELGGAGCTGRCTGVHLHFEVYQDGHSISPLMVIKPW